MTDMEQRSEVTVPTAPSQQSPWGKTSSVQQPCSFANVMDEEFAKTLQIEESQILKEEYGDDADYELAVELSSGKKTDVTSDDLLMAQMLQLQFDREHDNMLAREEKKYNGDSKLSISWAKYKTSSSSLRDPDDEEEDFDSTDEEDFTVMTPSDCDKTKTGLVTKHDATVCGRRNASKIMDKFPLGFQCGMDMDLKLSNSVYNSLKQHSVVEEKRSHRIHEKKEHSTTDMAVDSRTRILLFKLVNGGILESINGTISTGKESVVIHATGGKINEQLVPSECALKVFKTTLNEFKNRQKYIKDDYRFKDRFSKQNPRKIIRMWAEKEMHNLHRLREGGIRTPDAILLRKHILVMTFIGTNQKAAPKLKDVTLSSADKERAYEQSVNMMERMYQVCNLVHADLSEYNMLWHRRQVWFIDVSQSVEPTHPHGLEFLLRDCTNVSTFFTNMGVVGVLKPHELFNKVTQLDLQCGDHKKFLAQIESLQESGKFETCENQVTNFAFDYFFDQNITEQKEAKKREIGLVDEETGLVDEETDLVHEEIGLVDEETDLVDEETDKDHLEGD